MYIQQCRCCPLTIIPHQGDLFDMSNTPPASPKHVLKATLREKANKRRTIRQDPHRVSRVEGVEENTTHTRQSVEANRPGVCANVGR